MELTGKTAFVTGGSGDIGSAIAKALAGAGVDVAISYIGNLEGFLQHKSGSENVEIRATYLIRAQFPILVTIRCHYILWSLPC